MPSYSDCFQCHDLVIGYNAFKVFSQDAQRINLCMVACPVAHLNWRQDCRVLLRSTVQYFPVEWDTFEILN